MITNRSPIFRPFVLSICFLAVGIGTSYSQTEWDVRTAKQLESTPNGSKVHLFAQFERSTYLSNVNLDAAIANTLTAYREAKELDDEVGMATALMQTAAATMVRFGYESSQPVYSEAVERFEKAIDGKVVDAQYRIWFYSSQLLHEQRITTNEKRLSYINRLQSAIKNLKDNFLIGLMQHEVLVNQGLTKPIPKVEIDRLRKSFEKSNYRFPHLLCDALLARNRLMRKDPIDEVRADLLKILKGSEAEQLLGTQFWANMALSYVTQKPRIEDAIAYGEKARAIAEQINSIDFRASSTNNALKLALRAGQTPKAVEIAKQAKELEASVTDPTMKVNLRYRMLKTYILTGNEKQALSILDSSFTPQQNATVVKLRSDLDQLNSEMEKVKETAQQNLRLLNSERKEFAQQKDRLEKEKSEFEQSNAELKTDVSLARQDVDRFQFYTLIGFVVASTLAILLFLGLLRLFLVHRRLRHEVAENERGRHANKLLEERVTRTERMDSLGALAGGVAHDFNNLLVGVRCNADLLKNTNPTDEQRRAYVDSILSSAEKASQLSRKMLMYAGKQPAAIECYDLFNLVDGMIPLLSSGFSRQHEVILKPCKEQVLARVDYTQAEQIILNLVTNAHRAIDPRQGRIQISVGKEAIMDVNDPTLFGKRDSRGVFSYIEVSDNGAGISPDKIERIFEPFYSDNLQGRGLGLALVYGLVNQHNGFIRVRSTIGKGTSFRVYFPATLGPASEQVADSPSHAQKLPKTGTVVVIDDERQVLEVAERVAESYGWTAHVFDNGPDGISF
ncbi:MAG: ATP-binding protein, partial [Planctomycetota bacterium]